ncbi:MAG: EscU/YscU/HrcU family type III secretion system export apparatus switch protein, partial [Oscillospiraceae bacterium]
MAGEKTEKATPKKKSDERKKGNTYQSKEIVTVFSLIITFYSLKFLSPIILSSVKKSIKDFILVGATLEKLTMETLNDFFLDGCLVFVLAAIPLLLISACATVILTGAQTKFLMSFKALNFKGNRINPIQGFKKMFSMRGVIELVKSLLKITILGYICYSTIVKRIPTLPNMMDMSVEQAVMLTGETVMAIINGVIPIFILVAIGDYIYQWWDYEKNLRMSKQEIKEEYKQVEGDPQIKGKIRERQQQQARTRMMQSVPTADVIIRNPTHFAIAIKYDPEKDRA